MQLFFSKQYKLRLALLVGALCVITLPVLYIKTQKTSNVEVVTIEVTQGSSWKAVAESLVRLGVYAQPRLLMAYVLWDGQWRRLKPGEYECPSAYPLSRLLSDMVEGRQKIYTLSIIPGTNWTQLQKLIAEKPFSTDASLEAFQYPSFEGYFHPDTYYFVKNYPLKSILQKARTLSLEKITAVYAQRSASLKDLSLEELVVIASIIEREAALDSERPYMARVIYNRLLKGMPLQIDATMVHVAINAGTVFSARDLRHKHAYNTYKNIGLPPGPIAYPSVASLEAAAHPIDGDWLYYRLQCGKSHVFTRTFDEHKEVELCQN